MPAVDKLPPISRAGPVSEGEVVADAVADAVSVLSRRLRQPLAEGELTLAERSAVAKLERDGPTTAAALARLEQITPQSMGTTLAALESRGLVSRAKDPWDGRRVNLSLTDAGRAAVEGKHDAYKAALARELEANFTARELEQLLLAAPLLARLAHGTSPVTSPSPSPTQTL